VLKRNTPEKIEKKYKVIACGGTFDLFHKGHKDFLSHAFKISLEAIIGVMDVSFDGKENFESFRIRKKSVEDFIKQNNFNAEIIKIRDIYGPAISNKYPIETILVTKDTEKGARKINEKRKSLGMKPLTIIKTSISRADYGGKISSTRIKNGEIDRAGRAYIDNRLLSNDLILPEYLRSKLSRPFGELIKNLDKWIDNKKLDREKIILVGDIVTSKFNKNGIKNRLSIIDFVVRREKKFNSIFDLGFDNKTRVIEVDNPSGHVSSKLTAVVNNFFKTKKNETRFVIKVNGEEDLAVIPAVLASPLNYQVFYGQPDKGVVRIVITEKIKQEIRDIISKFEAAN